MSAGWIACGGFALGQFALGGSAYGAHVLSDQVRDPVAVDFFQRHLHWVLASVGRT